MIFKIVTQTGSTECRFPFPHPNAGCRRLLFGLSLFASYCLLSQTHNRGPKKARKWKRIITIEMALLYLLLFRLFVSANHLVKRRAEKSYGVVVSIEQNY